MGRPRIDLDPETLTLVAQALAFENTARAALGQAPITMLDYARRELGRAAQAQVAAYQDAKRRTDATTLKMRSFRVNLRTRKPVSRAS